MNKLFTHTDLDGVGCAIIAKLVYGDEIDISFCDYNEVDEKVGKCQPNNYDHIDITDISVGEKLGKSIDENYSNQVNLYDHHATAKDLDKYSWAVVKVNDEKTGLMTCGTEIYYNHIGQYIDKEYRLAVESFVKYVTLWDTWRWKEKNSGLAGVNAKKINTLFGIYGREKFIKWAIDHIKSGVFPNFTVADLSILEAKQNEVLRYIDEKDNQYIKRKDFAGRVFGVVFAENYISELGNALCERHPELAYTVIIDIGKGKVSYRTIRDDINLGKDIASLYAGGGHAKAAGSEFGKIIVYDVIDKLFKGRIIS